MNALFLEKLIAFRKKHALNTAKVFLSQKIRYQFSILGEILLAQPFLEQAAGVQAVNALLLVEARAAKAYWNVCGTYMATHAVWNSRKPHAGDPCNQLLDIGYHFLVGWLVKLFLELNLPTELGLFHRAQSANAHPLVYDFMEWLRPVLVDKTALTFFRKKKKVVLHISEQEIGHFIFAIKKELERRYYHRKLGYCITLAYWIKLVALELEKSIHHTTLFQPIFPSLRHETRCKKAPAESGGVKK